MTVLVSRVPTLPPLLRKQELPKIAQKPAVSIDSLRKELEAEITKKAADTIKAQREAEFRREPILDQRYFYNAYRSLAIHDVAGFHALNVQSAKKWQDPFLERLLKALLDRFIECKSSPHLQKFVLKMASSVHGDGKLTVFAAEHLIGSLTYLYDNYPEKLTSIPWDTFTLGTTFVQAKKAIEAAVATPHDPHTTLTSKTITSSSLLHVLENQYLLDIATLVVRPNGTLNRFFLPKLASSQFTQRRNEFEKEAQAVLNQFMANDGLISLFETIPLPPKGSVGQHALRKALGLDHAATLTLQDVRRVVLQTLLARIRQRNYDSCFTTALLILVKESSLKQMLQEIRLLLKDGYLSRFHNNALATFPAMFGFNYSELDKELTCPAADLFQIKAIACAFSILGKTATEIDAFIEEKKKNNITVSLYSIITTISSSDEKVCAALDTACSVFDLPLIRLWENAVTGMMTSSYKSEKQSKEQLSFYRALIKTFHTLSKKMKCVKHTQLFADALPDDVLKPLRLTDSAFEILNQVWFMVAPSIPPISKPTLHLHVYRDSSLTKITTNEEFGALIRMLFTQIVHPKEGSATPLLSSYTNNALAQVYETHFEKTHEHATPYCIPLACTTPFPEQLIACYAETAPFPITEIKFADSDADPGNDLGLQPVVLLDALEKIRLKLGTSNDLSLYAFTATHAFRVTPNNSSLFPQTDLTKEKWLESLSTQVKNIASISDQTFIAEFNKKFLNGIQDIVDECTVELDEFLAAFKGKPIQTTLKDQMDLIQETLKTCRNGEELTQEMFDIIDAFFIQILCQTFNRPHNGYPMLRFADLNYEENDAAGNQKVLLAMTISPQSYEWKFVHYSRSRVKPITVDSIEIYHLPVTKALELKAHHTRRADLREEFESLILSLNSTLSQLKTLFCPLTDTEATNKAVKAATSYQGLLQCFSNRASRKAILISSLIDDKVCITQVLSEINSHADVKIKQITLSVNLQLKTVQSLVKANFTTFKIVLLSIISGPSSASTPLVSAMKALTVSER